MKNFPLLCALAASIHQAPSLCAENTNIYKEAGYSFMGKSALVSTAALITLVAGYGLWTWWNKKPALKESTPPQVVEPTSNPESLAQTQPAVTEAIKTASPSKAPTQQDQKKINAKALAEGAVVKKQEMAQKKRAAAAKTE